MVGSWTATSGTARLTTSEMPVRFSCSNRGYRSSRMRLRGPPKRENFKKSKNKASSRMNS